MTTLPKTRLNELLGIAMADIPMLLLDGIPFRQLPGASRYYVSRCGLVYTTIKRRLLTQQNNSSGYRQVWLTFDDGSEKWQRVHRLVAVCFIPNPDQRPDVNHIDGNKANNHADNLAWCTKRENIRHAVDTGLRKTKRGAEHHLYGKEVSPETRAKMSAAKQGKVHPKSCGHYRTPAGTFPTLTTAAQANGVSTATVARYCRAAKKDDWALVPVLRHMPESDSPQTQSIAA